MKLNILNINNLTKVGHDRLINIISSMMIIIDSISVILKTSKFLKKTVLPLTFLTAIALPQISNAQYAPMANDTIWGNGMIFARDINENSISNAKLTFKAIDMQQIIPETEYEYIANNSGIIQYNVPVFIDTNYVGINNYASEQIKIFPTFGSELNATFPVNTKGALEIYDITGKKVIEQDFNTDHLYKNLESLPSAPYIYVIKTENDQQSGKFIKTNTPANGFTDIPRTTTTTPQTKAGKNLEDMVATYQIITEKEGYYPDTSYLQINEGENTWSVVHLTQIPGLPASQDFAGIVMDGNNDKAPMEGVLVVVEHEETGNIYNTYTDEFGYWIVNDLPVRMGAGPRQNYKVSIGEVSDELDKYGFINVPYEAPIYFEDEWSAQDTINNNFNAILYDKIPETSSGHIVDQTSNGYLGDTVYYYLDDSFNATQKNNIRGYFEQLKIDENDIFNFTESPTPLNNTGINISYGNPNTSSHETNYETPIGNLSPVLYSISSMGGGYNNYTVFVHEIKRGIGLAGVAWPEAESVMEDYATHYTEEDKLIGQFERNYWQEVYKNNSTYINLNNLVEDIDSKIELLGWK